MKSLLFLAVLAVSAHLVIISSALAKKGGSFQEIIPEEEAQQEASEKPSAKDSEEDVSAETEKKPALRENEEILSGTVRVVRRLDRTEVFFKDLKQSYVIPSNIQYNTIYRAFEESQKKGTAVSFKANSKSRQILSIESSSAASGSAASSTSTSSGKKGSQ